MSGHSRRQPSSTPSRSSSSFKFNTPSSNPARREPLPPTVITTPPWAHDEPPSPKDDGSSFLDTHPTENRASDVGSSHPSTLDLRSRRWTFALPRTPKSSRNPGISADRSERRLKDLWLPLSTSVRKEKGKDAEPGPLSNTHHDFGLSLTFPIPAAESHALPLTITPGWDTPWAPHVIPRDSEQVQERDELYNGTNGDSETTIWQKRKKTLRAFILTNVYVPLAFRFINIIFTTTALAVALHIRRIEIKGSLVGAVGSSPTLVIIFAPLTLVHVLIAIYLEYFGRPLGLWHTSGKLMHTLSEVLFICAWSAALSLCFDNFFTSLIPCASPSSMSWYNLLPRPPTFVPSSASRVGDAICDSQLALICLVGVGLMAYCANLIISLFRIFEKVKYHPATRVRV